VPVIKTTKAPPTDAPTNEAEPPPPTDVPETEPRTETCARGIWYCENFDDRNAQFWDLSPAWSIKKDGTNYLLSGSGHEWATLTEHEWDDFRVKFDLRLLQGTVHLNYRIKPVGNSVVRYYVGVSEKYIYLQKSEYGGSWVELKTSDYYVSPGDWHHVEIAGWGSHIAVYMDGELVLQDIDNDKTYLPSGSIAFETLDNSKAQIDNIEVMESGKEPPPDNGDTGGNGVITGANFCMFQGKTVGVETDYDTDRIGMDYDNFSAPDLFTCQQACINDTNCQAYTFNTYEYRCWLKQGIPPQTYGSGLISGIKTCVTPQTPIP